jgi:DNA-binding response OmpR family regulator
MVPLPVRAVLSGFAMDVPLRILAVDNEPTITLSLRYVFGDSRYDLTCAESGAAALANLDANPEPFDVIIVDQKMPNLSGVELVGAIRKRGLNGKIIVLSAHLSSEVRENYARMDVHDMLAKPFDIGELRSVVNRLAA